MMRIVSTILILGSLFHINARATENPIFHWKFDEGTGINIKDSGKNKNNGILETTSQSDQVNSKIWVDGMSGKAIYLNGTSYIQLNEPIGSFKEITIMVWIKTDKRKIRGTIFGNKADTLHTGFRFEYLPWWGRLSFQYGDKFATKGIMTEVNAVRPNFWSHIAVTYNGKTIKFYLNGCKIFEKQSSGEIAAFSKRPCIGMYYNGKTYGFIGIIDDLRIYERSLTNKEIMEVLVSCKKK